MFGAQREAITRFGEAEGPLAGFLLRLKPAGVRRALYAGQPNCFGWFMPTAEYMREYRRRPGVRDRELRNKREYDVFHQAENRARWQRRNQERKAAKAEWYLHNAKRIAKARKTKRDYVAKFGPVPKNYICTVADMAKALRLGRDPFAGLRASWKTGSKRGAKQGAATRKTVIRAEVSEVTFAQMVYRQVGAYTGQIPRRPTGPAVDQIRDCNQPDNRKGARPHRAALTARPR
jgi:hypothetical protein